MTAPDIFSAAFASDPYPLYRLMRDAYPLYVHPAANAYILSRHVDVCAALRDERFTTRSYAAQIEPLLGETLVQREGRDHARERRLLAAPFRGDRFEAMFAPAIVAVADDLIDGFRLNGAVELIGDFVTSYAVRALAVVVGLPPSDVDRFRSWYTALLRFGVNLIGDPGIHQAGIAARDALDSYLRPLVAARRRIPGPGLLSLLAAAEVDGQRLTDDAIVRSAMLMVFAGGETVEKTLATFVRNLLAHPDQLAMLRADRSLMDRALAESLRYTAPTHMVPRQTKAEVAVSGGVIPAEADVLCFLGSANRDERRFADPDRFDMLRADLDATRAFNSLADHTAFGLGRHFCLGAMMAKIEVGIAVDRLLEAMPDLRFAAGSPPRDEGRFLRGPQCLELRFEPAQHSQVALARG
jgi:cytochrome P450